MAGWREGGRAGLLLPALLAFCTLWRLPSLADPPWLNDEGTYATVGKALVDGEALYRQIWENKPPGVYLLYGSMHLLVGTEHLLIEVRILALLASLVVLLAVYRIASRVRDRWTGALALLFAGVLVDLPLLDGTSANAEIFLAAATSAGMALILPSLSRSVSAVPAESPIVSTPPVRSLGRDPQRPTRQAAQNPAPPKPPVPGGAGQAPPHGPPSWPLPTGAVGTILARNHSNAESSIFLLAGLAFGLALLFKLVAGADLFAALLIAAWPAAGCQARTRLAPIGGLLAGAALPIAAVALWLAMRGLLGDALYATVGYNRGYVATGQSLHALPLTMATLALPLALMVLAACLARRREGSMLQPAAAVTLWLALALLGALASGRSYPHYYLQVAPPLALALALLVARLCRQHGPRQRRVLIVVLTCWSLCVPLGSWLALRHEPVHPAPGSDQAGYYAHAWQYLTGRLDATAYGNSLDPRVERNLAAIQYLTDYPSTPRRLYIWGNAPWIYYLARYQHATRFASAYYRPAIPGGMAEVVAALSADSPPYILVIAPPAPTSVEIRALLRARYLPTYRVQDLTIYRLRATR